MKQIKSFLIRRFLQMIPLVLGITLLSFIVINLAPGDFLDQMRMNPDISREIIDRLEAQYGLDQPLWRQYVNWLGSLLRFDLGYSFNYRVPVSFLIGSRLFNTFLLSLVSMLFGWIIAIPIGIHAAVKKYSITDNVFTVFSFAGLSIPNFFLATILLFLVVRYGINLPIGGMTSIDYEWMSAGEKVIDLARHMVIPVIALGTASMAGWMRQMRGNLMDVLNKDFVKTARSKGLSERIVIYKHAVRNAINPLITMFGFSLSTLFSGAALTEAVTSWPGLGDLIIEAVMMRDYYLVMASLIMSSVMLIIGNLVADIMLAFSDPRIRYN